MLAGAINVLGLVGWLWMLPRIEPLDWSRGTVRLDSAIAGANGGKA